MVTWGFKSLRADHFLVNTNIMNKQNLIKYWSRLVEEENIDSVELDETSRRQKAMQAMRGTSKKIKSIAILTSENPRFPEKSAAQNKDNKESRKQLEAELRTSHLAWFPVKGQYFGDVEKSYIIFNISREDAVKLGKRYGQESIIFISGNKCEFWSTEDGIKYKPTQIRTLDQTIDATSDKDNFTQISKAFKFRIPFFDDSEENADLYVDMVDYLDESIAKRNLPEETINNFIKANVENECRGFNKWTHNGQLHRTDFWWPKDV